MVGLRHEGADKDWPLRGRPLIRVNVTGRQ